MLQIKNLHAPVDGKDILKGLSLEIPTGETHAIMGPNGSEKSTLSYVIAGREVLQNLPMEFAVEAQKLVGISLEEALVDFRVATPDDYKLAAEISMKSHQQNYGYFMPEIYFQQLSLADSASVWKGTLAESLYKGKTWLAQVDGQYIGVCNASLARKYPQGYPGYIDNIHLLADYKGRGISQKMFELCKNYLLGDLGLEGFYLFVREKNSKARAFYERNGGTLLNLREADIIAPGIDLAEVSYGWKEKSNAAN